MAEKKRKTRDEQNYHNKLKTRRTTQSKSQILAAPTKTSNKNKMNERDGKKNNKTGPRLPSRLRKEVDSMNYDVANSEDEEIDTDFEANDVYEYEEGVPEEESRKNKRFDTVDSFEYELPEDFKDENVPSDDDVEGSDEDDANAEEEDNGRHERMLQGITKLPLEAFQGKKKKNDVVVSEAYPESEYNPSRDVLDGDSHITVEDLLNPLHGTPGFSEIERRARELDRKSISVLAPLSKPDREIAERMATYEHSKKDITKWEHLVKKNREASTISFKGDVDLGVSTVGAIASEFQPRTDFEKKMNALVNDKRVVEAHAKDGATLLEMNKIPMEEVKRDLDHRAKMRSLLCLHEIKAKNKNKIKSKTYHRLLKKDRLKSASCEMRMDPEAAKEHAKKQEFKRTEERLTLKHRNKSKWAKQILKRGLSTQDEGTRAAIAAQLHEHERLKRKMHSMKDDNSSSDDSSNDDDDDDEAAIIEKAKDEMQKMLAKEDKDPKGLRSFPFMVRAADKGRKIALEEYDLFMKQLKCENGTDEKVSTVSSGRRTFGATKREAPKSVARTKPEIDYGSSSSGEEEGFMVEGHVGMSNQETKYSQKDVDIDADLFREKSEIDHDHLFKSFDEIVANPGPKTTYDVGILAPVARKKIKNKSKEDRNTKSSPKAIRNIPPIRDLEEAGEDNDLESEGQMVDGMLTATTQPAYELPSHEESLRRGFAGDDVEDEFVKDKRDILNEEIPEPEKPMELPGWGLWPDEQHKRGLPSWMVIKHDDAKKKREEALKGRKDAPHKDVIISEKPDKKTDKLHPKKVPYPHTENDLYEESIRMPIGPDFNPASKMGALIRPVVVKTTGLNIEPIKFQDVNPHEHSEDHKDKPEKGKKKTNKRKNNGGKTQKKVSKKIKDGH